MLATGRESIGGHRRPPDIQPLDEKQEVLEDVRSLSAAADEVAHRAVDGVVEGVYGVVNSGIDGVDGVVSRVDGVEIGIALPLLKGHSPKEPEEEP